MLNYSLGNIFIPRFGFHVHSSRLPSQTDLCLAFLQTDFLL